MDKLGAPAASAAWVTNVSLLFLAFNCAVAIYNARGDPWAVAFVAAALADLVSLFHFLRRLEETPREDAGRRRRLKVAVWVTSTTLTVMFGAKVAAMMPPAVAVLVWAMSGGTVATGFYLFFLYKEPSRETSSIKSSDGEKKIAAAA